MPRKEGLQGGNLSAGKLAGSLRQIYTTLPFLNSSSPSFSCPTFGIHEASSSWTTHFVPESFFSRWDGAHFCEAQSESPWCSVAQAAICAHLWPSHLCHLYFGGRVMEGMKSRCMGVLCCTGQGTKGDGWAPSDTHIILSWKTHQWKVSEHHLGHRTHARHGECTGTQMGAGRWLKRQLRNVYEVILKYLHFPQEGEHDRSEEGIKSNEIPCKGFWKINTCSQLISSRCITLLHQPRSWLDIL